MCEGQRTNLTEQNRLSPYTLMWVPGMNLGHQTCIIEQEAPWPTEPPHGPLMTYPQCICPTLWHCQASSVLSWHCRHVQLSLKPWTIWLGSWAIRKDQETIRMQQASSWPDQKAQHIWESEHTCWCSKDRRRHLQGFTHETGRTKSKP